MHMLLVVDKLQQRTGFTSGSGVLSLGRAEVPCRADLQGQNMAEVRKYNYNGMAMTVASSALRVFDKWIVLL